MGKGSLYLRPLLLGTGPILGLGPAPSYTFTIFAAAVGAYFKVSGVALCTSRMQYRVSGLGVLNTVARLKGTPQRNRGVCSCPCIRISSPCPELPRLVLARPFTTALPADPPAVGILGTAEHYACTPSTPYHLLFPCFSLLP